MYQYQKNPDTFYPANIELKRSRNASSVSIHTLKGGIQKCGNKRTFSSSKRGHWRWYQQRWLWLIAKYSNW